MIYPSVMFGFALVVIGVLVTVVLPQITELLASLNQPLPFYTLVIIETAHFMRSYWWTVVLAVMVIVLLIRAVLRTLAGRANFDRGFVGRRCAFLPGHRIGAIFGRDAEHRADDDRPDGGQDRFRRRQAAEQDRPGHPAP